MNQCGLFLIVEDEIAQQDYLKLLLQRLGLTAHIAGSKKEAERMLSESISQNKIYQVIFLDIMLPDGTGHEILLRLRSDPKWGIYAHTKVVMLTALDDLKYIAGSFAEQCDGYLTKPLEKEQLVTMLRNFHVIE
ncbi:response regulator transcription factor [Gracilinema caldarium]|uniref:response regulator transcription factor n=1 Tax=Gracilinema caldarium TaxID=215591 RepID=UPI0026E93369|nr:response regulator [Gracilinema caldarium]